MFLKLAFILLSSFKVFLDELFLDDFYRYFLLLLPKKRKYAGIRQYSNK